jgi:UDP:flavonoid glycosyltransferase YjiC (YdhE family)
LVAVEHGLEPVASIPQLLEDSAALLIAPGCPELEPLLTAAPKVRFVGPLLYSRIDLRPLPPIPTDRPLVYVYLSAGEVTLDDLLDVFRNGLAEAARVHFVVSARRHFGRLRAAVPLRVCRLSICRRA